MMAKEDRGFASMDPSKQREIASKGGRAAHVKGTAHEWSSDEARAAGRKGGEKRSANARAPQDSSSFTPASDLGIGNDTSLRTGSPILEAGSHPGHGQSGSASN